MLGGLSIFYSRQIFDSKSSLTFSFPRFEWKILPFSGSMYSVYWQSSVTWKGNHWNIKFDEQMHVRLAPFMCSSSSLCLCNSLEIFPGRSQSRAFTTNFCRSSHILFHNSNVCWMNRITQRITSRFYQISSNGTKLCKVKF